MNPMTAVQRAELAEAMLPKAAHLAAIVHGDGGPEDVAQALAGLDDTQKNALIVVLAGLVDLEQPVGKGLSWLNVTKHGALPVPSWMEQRPLRDHIQDPELDDDETFIDEVAVRQHLDGKNLYVTPRERLEAVARGVRKGMVYPDFDAMYGLKRGSTSTFVSRMRKRLLERGEQVPEMTSVRWFSEDEVIAIRERAAAGATHVELAMSFDSSRKTIQSICRGRTYAQYGGPVRSGPSDASLKKSRQFMCGHGDDSQAARTKTEMEEVA
jgi:hypothetical protein